MGALLLVAEVVFLFAVAEVAWLRATVVFFVVALEVDAVVAFRAPAPVLVGLATVVPEDADDDTLPLRSSWRVAGLGSGERVVLLVAVAARLAGLLTCEGGLLSLIEVDVLLTGRMRVLSVSAGMLADVDLSGLMGFRGDMGLAR